MSNDSTLQSPPIWENLPPELLQLIGKHLDSRIDVFRFRAVSTTWRSAVPPSFRQSSDSPPLNLPPPVESAANLTLVTICRLENKPKTSACLVKVIESKSGHLQLLSLPSATSKIQYIMGTNTTKFLNMLDLRLVELSKAHVITTFRNNFRRVVSLGDKGILVLFNSNGKLAFWGFGDKNWTFLGQEGTHYDDLIKFKNNQCYVIDNLGIISWIDDSSLNLIQYSPPLCGFGQLKRLVESQGCFYVVDSYMEEEVREIPRIHRDPNVDRRMIVDMKVYKLDEEWGMWVEVKSVGDRVFVLGKEVNFSVDVGEFPECQGNWVYFIDSNEQNRNVSCARFFRFEDGSIRTVECFPTYRRLFSPSMMFPFVVSDDELAKGCDG